MNPEHLSDEQFDLLVDGELSESERRALLGRLDGTPDGWRRCALAFLEAQCFKDALGSNVQPIARAAPAAEPASRFRWGNLLALAATFLVALGLGVGLRERWNGPGAMVAEDRPPGGVQPSAASPAWKMVHLASHPAGGAEEVPLELPAVERERVDDDWLRSLPPAMPPDVLRALRASGHQVQQSRELLPVPMPDGRRLVVPYDQFDVQYVGRPREY